MILAPKKCTTCPLSGAGVDSISESLFSTMTLLSNGELNPQFSVVFLTGFHGVVSTHSSSPSLAQRMANVQDQEAFQIVDAEVQ